MGDDAVALRGSGFGLAALALRAGDVGRLFEVEAVLFDVLMFDFEVPQLTSNTSKHAARIFLTICIYFN